MWSSAVLALALAVAPAAATTAPSPAADPATQTAIGWGTGDGDWTRVPDDLLGVTQVAIGGYTAVALLDDGTAVTWGEYGARGPRGETDLVAVDASSTHQLGLRSDGTVAAWGAHPSHPPAGLDGVTAVAAGLYEDLAVRTDGSVVAWNQDGPRSLPSEVHDVDQVADGPTTAVVVRSDGTVVSWRTFPVDAEPVAEVVPEAAGAVDVSANDTSAALLPDGSIVTWGSRYVPTRIPAAGPDESPYVQVATGANHVLALHADGHVSAWGENGNSQADVPSYVTGATSIDADQNQSIATATAQVLTVDRDPARVPELDGQQVTYTVSRSGPFDQPTSVAVATGGEVGRQDGAWSGRSAVFEPGQASAQVSYLVHADTRRESDEQLRPVLRLSGAQRLASPVPAAVLEASDQQPDLMVANVFGRWIGDDVYDATGSAQQRDVVLRRGRTTTVRARLCTEGQPSMFGLRAQQKSGHIRATYVVDRRNRTEPLTSSGIRLRVGSCVPVEARLRPAAAARSGDRFSSRLTAAWTGDVRTVDAIRVRARVR